MVFESAHVRITAEHGTATLWLDFPGQPVNGWDAARLREFDAAIAAVERNPFVRVLVVRSAKPAGFCAGIRPAALASLIHPTDRAAFAWLGQEVFACLAGLNAVTVALLDGPCLGAGLELALACDYRLCVARPTTHLGFPDAPAGVRPGFGGTVRLRARIGRKRAAALVASGGTLSGREARTLGLVDHAFCERRAKIELRSFLDRLERKPWRKRSELFRGGFAEERRAFAEALDPARIPEPATHPAFPHPRVVGLIGDGEAASRRAAELALGGSEVLVCGTGAGVFAGIAAALARGFVTPLEADQAEGRVKRVTSLSELVRAEQVWLSPGESAQALPRFLRFRTAVIGGEAEREQVAPAETVPVVQHQAGRSTWRVTPRTKSLTRSR